VELEQPNMPLALSMAKMAKGGFSRAAIEEMQYVIQKPCTEVREEKKWGVECPGHQMVKAAIERHPAMLHQNHIPRCLPCQNSTANNPQTHWNLKGTGAPLPNGHRQQTPDPTASLPGTPPTSISNTSGAQCHEIINLTAEYAYSHTSLGCTESFTLDVSN